MPKATQPNQQYFRHPFHFQFQRIFIPLPSFFQLVSSLIPYVALPPPPSSRLRYWCGRSTNPSTFPLEQWVAIYHTVPSTWSTDLWRFNGRHCILPPLQTDWLLLYFSSGAHVYSFEIMCIQPVQILVGTSKEHMLGFDIWWLLHVFLLRDVSVKEVARFHNHYSDVFV